MLAVARVYHRFGPFPVTKESQFWFDQGREVLRDQLFDTHRSVLYPHLHQNQLWIDNMLSQRYGPGFPLIRLLDQPTVCHVLKDALEAFVYYQHQLHVQNARQATYARTEAAAAPVTRPENRPPVLPAPSLPPTPPATNGSGSGSGSSEDEAIIIDDEEEDFHQQIVSQKAVGIGLSKDKAIILNDQEPTEPGSSNDNAIPVDNHEQFVEQQSVNQETAANNKVKKYPRKDANVNQIRQQTHMDKYSWMKGMPEARTVNEGHRVWWKNKRKEDDTTSKSSRSAGRKRSAETSSSPESERPRKARKPARQSPANDQTSTGRTSIEPLASTSDDQEQKRSDDYQPASNTPMSADGQGQATPVSSVDQVQEKSKPKGVSLSTEEQSAWDTFVEGQVAGVEKAREREREAEREAERAVERRREAEKAARQESAKKAIGEEVTSKAEDDDDDGSLFGECDEVEEANEWDLDEALQALVDEGVQIDVENEPQKQAEQADSNQGEKLESFLEKDCEEDRATELSEEGHLVVVEEGKSYVRIDDTSAGEDSSSEDDDGDDSEDDEDSPDVVDEYAAAQAAERNQQVEEIADLERQVENQRTKVKNITNQLLKQRASAQLATLERDLRIKKDAFEHERCLVAVEDLSRVEGRLCV